MEVVFTGAVVAGRGFEKLSPRLFHAFRSSSKNDELLAAGGQA